MKKIYALVLVVFFGHQAFSQSPSLRFFTKKSKTEITNGSHTIYGDAARFVVSEEFYSVMTGVDSVLYGAKRLEIDTVTGTADYYCWKECYIPKNAGTLPVWIATDSLMTYKDDTVAKFSTYLNPNSKLGSPKYRYVFTPKGFPNDTVYVDITFDILTIGLDVHNQVNVEVYPNPSTDFLNVSIGELDSKGLSMRLINPAGQVVMSNVVINNVNRIDVSAMNSGLYVFELRRNQVTLARKKILIN